MDFTLSDDQRLLQEAAERFAITQNDGTTDPSPKIVALGWPGLAVPEAFGGFAGGAVEALLVMEALGRTLAPACHLLGAVLGCELIATLGTAAQQQATLPSLSEGRLRLALPAPGPGLPGFIAYPTQDGYRLNGASALLPGAAQADLVLLPARLPRGPACSWCRESCFRRGPTCCSTAATPPTWLLSSFTCRGPPCWANS